MSESPDPTRRAPDISGAGRRPPAGDGSAFRPAANFGFDWNDEFDEFDYEGRPAFTPTANGLYPGAGNHRRHILPSHLLLATLCRAANFYAETRQLHILHTRLRGFATRYGVAVANIRDPDNIEHMCRLLEVVARLIFSNGVNLWPGPGPENTVIGFLRRDVLNVKRLMLVEQGESPYKTIRKAVERLWALRRGMHAEVRTEKLLDIIEMVQSTGPLAQRAVRSLGLAEETLPGSDSHYGPRMDDVTRVAELLSSVADSLALDLNAEAGFREQNRAAIDLYARLFDYAHGEREGGDVIWQILNDFMPLPQDRPVRWQPPPVRNPKRPRDDSAESDGEDSDSSYERDGGGEDSDDESKPPPNKKRRR